MPRCFGCASTVRAANSASTSARRNLSTRRSSDRHRRKATSWLCFERPDRVAGLVTRLCDPWILSADTRRPAVFLADASFAAKLRSWAEPCRRRIMAKSSRNSSIALAACAVAVLALSSAASQQKAAPGQTSDTKDELAQNFLVEHEIWRVPHVVGALRAGRPVPPQSADQVPPDQRKPVPGAYGAEMLTKKGVFGITVGHQNRHLAIDPKTGALYVGVGSSGNLGVEPEPKATIQRFDADGSNQTTVASGTRNPTALAFHPQTGELWSVVQERDGLGDNLPSDYLIRVQQGGFYGWPYAYIGKHPQPGFAQQAPDKVSATIAPDLLFQAHSSLLDLAFYNSEQFPADYKGSLFVALKGSWNRSEPTGYKIVRVPFKDGKPEGYYENFATGFWASGEHRAEVWGRPAALAVAKDGSLLIADDTGGTIWRISYTGAAKSAGAPAEKTGSEKGR